MRTKHGGSNKKINKISQSLTQCKKTVLDLQDEKIKQLSVVDIMIVTRKIDDAIKEFGKIKERHLKS